MAQTTFDLIVIGAGPGGYVAAIRAAQLGMNVACVDERTTLGGTCLNVGCIPSKALLHSSHLYTQATMDLKAHGITVDNVGLDLGAMMARKDKVVEDLTKGVLFLFKKNKVTFVQGRASFKDAKTLSVEGDAGTTEITAPKIVIATGSSPTTLTGVEIDEKTVVTSTGALSLDKVPEHLIVIGGGYIGLEMGSVWRRLGAKVTVIEYFDRLVPALDREVATALMKSLKNQGMEFMLSTKVARVEKTKGGLNVFTTPADGGNEEKLSCDILLSCAGRKPHTQGLNLETIGLNTDERGFITVDGHFATSVPGVYAIGDVIGGAMLAHKAEEEGVALAEMLAGQKPHVNYGAIPAIIYTSPEVATVGQTQEQLEAKGVPFVVGKFPFSANARARANAHTEGFVKILSHAETDEILGIHIIQEEAGTMIAEAALALEYRASSEDVARTCHAHPTVNEAVKEAALDALKRAIHI